MSRQTDWKAMRDLERYWHRDIAAILTGSQAI
jgi:hypothetical protein